MGGRRTRRGVQRAYLGAPKCSRMQQGRHPHIAYIYIYICIFIHSFMYLFMCIVYIHIMVLSPKTSIRVGRMLQLGKTPTYRPLAQLLERQPEPNPKPTYTTPRVENSPNTSMLCRRQQTSPVHGPKKSTSPLRPIDPSSDSSQESATKRSFSCIILQLQPSPNIPTFTRINMLHAVWCHLSRMAPISAISGYKFILCCLIAAKTPSLQNWCQTFSH